MIQYDPALYQWNMSVANNPAISGVSYSDVNSLVSSNSELQLARIRMRLSFLSISQPRVHQF